MTDLAFEESELESSDYGEEDEGYDGDESYDEGESFDVEGLDDEASAAARRRRRRARQLELARRRRRARALALRRARPAPPARPVRSAQAAVAAVKQLDLETKVHDDEQRRAIAALSNRTDRTEYAAVATVGATQLQAALQPRFPALANPYVRAAFAAAPLAVLSPRKRGTGLQSLLDPRVMGVGLSFGLAFLGDRMSRGSAVHRLEITGGNSYPATGNLRIFVDPTDSRGALVPGRTANVTVTAPAKVTPQSDGSFQIKGGSRNDQLVVTAELDGIVRRFPVNVT